MRKSFSIVAFALLAACGGGGSAGSSSPQVQFAYILSGGSGLTVSPGPCIASGSITSSDPNANVGPSTDVDVVSQGPGRGYRIDAERGANSSVSFHARAGATISVEGATLTLVDPSPKKGTDQGFSISVRLGN
jgi:hypothetical protein